VSPGLGVSGRIAAFFQAARITPLIALVALLLGVFAVVVTPREEEPQINVTMANVIIPFPGASAQDVEQMVAAPAEQVLAQIVGIEHIIAGHLACIGRVENSRVRCSEDNRVRRGMQALGWKVERRS